ncbi:TPA: hypothetical protein H1012_00870 [archaeon]|nr:hypothetical protein [Candidatus Naiadarchaeales archaeon SRR2090159.bin1288]
MKANLQTSIDTFVDEIKKRGKISFSEAQGIFGISEEQVEEWAKLLSEHKDEIGIEVHYPTFGEPVIVATAVKKSAEIQQKIAKLEKSSGDLENILEKYSEEGGPKKPVVERQKESPQKPPSKFKFTLFAKKEKPSQEAGGTLIADELRQLEQELEETKRAEKTIDALSQRAKEIEESAKAVHQKEEKLIIETQSVQKTLSEVKRGIDLVVPAIQKNIRVIETMRLNPKLASEIKATIRRIQTDLDEIEGYARKFETTKAKSRLASLLNKAATPRKLKKKLKKHEKKRRQAKRR